MGDIKEKSITAYGVTVKIHPDGSIDIVGAKKMNFVSEEMDFYSRKIRMKAEDHMILESSRIDLNPREE